MRDGILVLADPASRYTLDYDNPNRDVDTGEEVAAIRIISVRSALPSEINQGSSMDEDIKPTQQGQQAPATEPEIDPDNPPLTGKEVWRPGKERILKRMADHKAKVAAKGKPQL